MKIQEASEIAETRELLRQFELLEDHAERVQKFEEALDHLNSYIEESDCSKTCQLALNLKHTYSKKLIEQLPSLNALDIDDWSTYAILLLLKLQKETDIICAKDPSMRANYQNFISIWSNECIQILRNKLPKSGDSSNNGGSVEPDEL